MPLFRSFCVAGVFLLLAGTNSGLAADDELARAKKAWQDREAKVRTLHAVGEDEEVAHVASYKLLAAATSSPLPVPAKDTAFTTSFRMTLDARKFRYDSQTQLWSFAAKAFQACDYTSVSTGDRQLIKFAYPNSGRPTEVSDSTSRTSGTDEQSAAVAHITLAVRGGSGTFPGPKLDLYEPTGKRVRVDGRECVEFVRESRENNRKDYLYLDPKRDYSVRRCDGYQEGKLTTRCTVEHSPDPIAGWLPVSWSSVWRNKQGELITAHKVTVREYRINPAVAPDEFDPAHAPGTFVVEEKNGVGGQALAHVVREDGSPGVRVPLRAGVDQAYLVEANRRSEATKRVWIALGVVALILAVGGVWYFRRRGRLRRVVA